MQIIKKLNIKKFIKNNKLIDKNSPTQENNKFEKIKKKHSNSEDIRDINGPIPMIKDGRYPFW